MEPQWNSDDPKAQVTCGSCHGIGPALTRTGAVHPAGKDCFTCHETVAEDGTIANWELHIDGRVQTRGIAGCNSCHGNDDNPAPPTDLNGESDTTVKTVGAHQAHLQDMALATALICADCHPAVTTVDSLGTWMGPPKYGLVPGPDVVTPVHNGMSTPKSARIHTVMAPPF